MSGNGSPVIDFIRDVLVVALGSITILFTCLSLYLLLLAVASLRRPSQIKLDSSPSSRFAVIISAHEEELVIGQLLNSINKLEYPRELFSVHIVADHCTDRTAAIARSMGATVYERNDPDPKGKSWSLNWLVQKLVASNAQHPVDAFIVLDADSIVSSTFLLSMDARLRAGSDVVQGLVQIDTAGTNRMGQLRALAYEFISYLRPLGRSNMGLSAGLRGNGMCIAFDCAARFPWNPESLTEDYELHGRLLASGMRVTFAPEALVRTELPHSLSGGQPQSERWDSGRLVTMSRQAPALIARGIRSRSWANIDGAIELLIPPFSIFMALMVVLLGLTIVSGVFPLMVVAAIGLAAQCLYTLRGLALASVRNPHIYRALLMVPVFVAWRLWRYAGVLKRRGRVPWTRTVRTPPN